MEPESAVFLIFIAKIQQKIGTKIIYMSLQRGFVLTHPVVALRGVNVVWFVLGLV